MPAPRCIDKVAGLLQAKFGPEILAMSLVDNSWVGGGRTLSEVLGGKRFGCILELGTYQGVGAACLACHADLVVTIDLRLHPCVPHVLSCAGMQDKVVYAVAHSETANGFIRRLDFDLAVVDTFHGREGVKGDFDLVKRCGSVLLHDYPASATGHDGAGWLIDVVKPPGDVDRAPPFAWWTAKEPVA